MFPVFCTPWFDRGYMLRQITEAFWLPHCRKLWSLRSCSFSTIVDIPFVTQRQILMVQAVWRTIETSQLQYASDRRCPCCAGRTGFWWCPDVQKTVVSTVAVPVSSFTCPLLCTISLASFQGRVPRYTARVVSRHSTTSVAILAQVVDIRRGFLRLGALSGAILSKRTRFILSSLVFCVLDSGCRLRRYPCRNSMSPSLEPSLELWLNHTRYLWVGTP